MLNTTRLKDILTTYKQLFIEKIWIDEKYKWEAVKCFQDNWDINADNFTDMLKQSLSKTGNLLMSANNFPGKMLEIFAEAAPEEVRAMFMALFNERNDVVSRILDFKDKSTVLLERYGNGAGQHYQYENAISTYLWLRYPDKYYIYKYSEIKQVAEILESNYSFKKGAYHDNLHNFYALYDEICGELQQDSDLKNLLNSQLDASCYVDNELRTLTIDVGFFMSRRLSSKTVTSFTDALPNAIKRPEFIEWLKTNNVNTAFTQYEYGIRAIEIEYQVDVDECYNQDKCTDLLRQVQNDTKGMKDTNRRNWSSYLKKYIEFKDSTILKKFEASPAIWKISHGTENTGISDNNKEIFLKKRIVVVHGTTKAKATSKIPQGQAFCNEIKKGDYFYLCYGNTIKLFGRIIDDEATENSEMQNGWMQRSYQEIALPVNDAPYTGQKKWWTPNDNSTCVKVDDENMFEQLILQPYFGLSLAQLFNKSIKNDTYTKENFLNEVYMTENKYSTLVSLLKNKRNVILQGAPGVGKTFTAKRLAYSIMGQKNDEYIEFIQFHQNYSYEDFMLGYKPVKDGFALKYGVFYRFCQKAMSQPDKDFFFIIDEINRGNMSKIFGELLMLIEHDYRGEKMKLAYNGCEFFVPQNLYIIGMMNTADRSLAMIDYALRRRFSFFEIEPGFESKGFKKYQLELNNETFSNLISKIEELNREIMLDKSLGKGFCIGHSYFCGQTICRDDWLQNVVDYDILPMLGEYWFDDTNKLQRWENILHGVFQ